MKTDRTFGRASTAVTALFMLCSISDRAAPQDVRMDALSLQPGVHARIIESTAHSKYTIITVASTSRDSLRYSLLGSADMKSISWQQVGKMDVSMGGHRHFGRGLGIGLLVGLVGGAILGASIAPGQDFTRGLDAAVGAAYFGFFGAIGGGVIGLAWRTENWGSVTIPRTSSESNPMAGPAR